MFIVFIKLSAQDSLQQEKNWKIDGYYGYLNSNIFDSIQSDWMIANSFYNRFNFEYQLTKNVQFTLQMRNRFIYGDLNTPFTGNSIYYETDKGLMKLSKNFIDKKDIIFNSNIDRVNLKFSVGKHEFQIGRQRINWGQTMVWNPNDIFNASSYFDFDYSEKPGSDAVRYQFYSGPASNIEIAVKANADHKLTAAGKILTNKFGYDFQLLTGIVEEKDYVAGLGWAGNLKNVGFKGEASYFIPTQKSDTLKNCLSATVSFEYTTSNSIYFLTQILYTDLRKNQSSNLGSFYLNEPNASNLSNTEWNLFFMVQYPVTPLLTAGFSGMYFPKINGLFCNPSISYSLGENSQFDIFWQYFIGEIPYSNGLKSNFQMNLIFLRFRWNF